MQKNETNIILQGKIFKVKVCARCGHKFFGVIGKRCSECGMQINKTKIA